MNLNAIFSIINLIAAVIGSLAGFDWAHSGLPADTAVKIAAFLLAANNGLKMILQYWQSGLFSWFLPQPPAGTIGITPAAAVKINSVTPANVNVPTAPQSSAVHSTDLNQSF